MKLLHIAKLQNLGTPPQNGGMGCRAASCICAAPGDCSVHCSTHCGIHLDLQQTKVPEEKQRKKLVCVFAAATGVCDIECMVKVSSGQRNYDI
jgi:hypothetical protein